MTASSPFWMQSSKHKAELQVLQLKLCVHRQHQLQPLPSLSPVSSAFSAVHF